MAWAPVPRAKVHRRGLSVHRASKPTRHVSQVAEPTAAISNARPEQRRCFAARPNFRWIHQQILHNLHVQTSPYREDSIYLTITSVIIYVYSVRTWIFASKSTCIAGLLSNDSSSTVSSSFNGWMTSGRQLTRAFIGGAVELRAQVQTTDKRLIHERGF